MILECKIHVKRRILSYTTREDKMCEDRGRKGKETILFVECR